MWPYALNLGPFSLTAYGLMAAMGVVAALGIIGWSSVRSGQDRASIRDFAVWMVVWGLLGSRLFYVVFHWSSFASRPLDSLRFWLGGLMFQGGLLTSLVVALWILKRKGQSFWMTGDSLAPALSLGQALGRVGCFLAGCCYGRPTELPLAITFPLGSLAPSLVPLYPTQLMEASGLVILTLVISAVLAYPHPRGAALAIYLVGSGLLRLLVDQFRGDFRGELICGWAPTSWIALGLVLVGLVMCIYVWRASPPHSLVKKRG